MEGQNLNFKNNKMQKKSKQKLSKCKCIDHVLNKNAEIFFISNAYFVLKYKINIIYVH